jgi:hypothetical protein
MTRWLLRLYPRAWRDRYGDEFVVLMADEGNRPRVLLDVVRAGINERLRGDLVGWLRVVRNILGAFSMIHTVNWAIYLIGGDGAGAAANWWTVDALLLSAALQARSAALALVVTLTVLALSSRGTRAERSDMLHWLGFVVTIAVAVVEVVLSAAGVPPTRQAAELLLGSGSHVGLFVGAMIVVNQVVRTAGHHWENPKPLPHSQDL